MGIPWCRGPGPHSGSLFLPSLPQASYVIFCSSASPSNFLLHHPFFLGYAWFFNSESSLWSLPTGMSLLPVWLLMTPRQGAFFSLYLLRVYVFFIEAVGLKYFTSFSLRHSVQSFWYILEFDLLMFCVGFFASIFIDGIGLQFSFFFFQCLWLVSVSV